RPVTQCSSRAGADKEKTVIRRRRTARSRSSCSGATASSRRPDGSLTSRMSVDDDPSILRALHRLVQSNGYTVASFLSARDFLDALRLLSTALTRPRRPPQRQRVRPPEAPGRRREEDPDHLHYGPRRRRDPASPRKVRGGRAPLEARGRAGVACRDPSCNRAGRQPRRGGTKVQSPDRRTANTVGATRATRSSAIVASAQFVTR